MALWLLLTFAGITAGHCSSSWWRNRRFWKNNLNVPSASCLGPAFDNMLTITCFLIILAAFLPFGHLMAFLLSASGIGQLDTWHY
jgi:hypothetical protein